MQGYVVPSTDYHAPPPPSPSRVPSVSPVSLVAPTIRSSSGGGGRATPRGHHTTLDPNHAASEAAFWSAAGLASPAVAAVPSRGGHAPESPSPATPSELRAERELERTRRRNALRQKHNKRSSKQNSPAQSPVAAMNSLSPLHAALAAGTLLPTTAFHPNDTLNLHPSLQHAIHSHARAHAATSGRIGHDAVRSTVSLTATLSPQSVAAPLSVGAGVGSMHGIRRSTMNGGDDSDEVARGSMLEVPPHMVEAEMDPLEWAQHSLFTTVASMDAPQRGSSLQWISVVHGVLTLAFLIASAATFEQFYASLAVHWTAFAIGVVSFGLTYLLRKAAPELDTSKMLTVSTAQRRTNYRAEGGTRMCGQMS